ncbi:MAG: hypothetical protein Q9224_007089 [Gallowayella concinna]
MYFPISTLFTTFLFLPCLLGNPINPSGTNPLSTNDAVTIAAINQLLSLFSISLDLQTVDALNNVYAPDAQNGEVGGGDPLVGIPAIIEFYTNTFQNASFKTEHTSDTVYAFDLKRTTAKSISYAEVSYFGPPEFERGGALFVDRSVVFKEKFEHEFVKLKQGWRIKKQVLTILSVEGDKSLLPPR